MAENQQDYYSNLQEDDEYVISDEHDLSNVSDNVYEIEEEKCTQATSRNGSDQRTELGEVKHGDEETFMQLSEVVRPRPGEEMHLKTAKKHNVHYDFDNPANSDSKASEYALRGDIHKKPERDPYYNMKGKTKKHAETPPKKCAKNEVLYDNLHGTKSLMESPTNVKVSVLPQDDYLLPSNNTDSPHADESHAQRNYVNTSFPKTTPTPKQDNKKVATSLKDIENDIENRRPLPLPRSASTGTAREGKGIDTCAELAYTEAREPPVIAQPPQQMRDYRESKHATLDDVKTSATPDAIKSDVILPKASSREPANNIGTFLKNYFNPMVSRKAKRNWIIVVVFITLIIVIIVLATQVK